MFMENGSVQPRKKVARCPSLLIEHLTQRLCFHTVYDTTSHPESIEMFATFAPTAESDFGFGCALGVHRAPEPGEKFPRGIFHVRVTLQSEGLL